MSAYESFARVYDMFMDNIPYKEWCNYLTGLLKEYEVEDGLVLELGCGTGNATRLLSDAGYDMIGVDNAPDMLEIALEKKEEEGQDILYLCQDMREFELYGTVKAIVSICDSMNYITEDEDLLEVFKLVNNYLDPEGVFIFDLNTVYKYEKILGEQTIAENREDASFIWDNYYDEEVQKLRKELQLDSLGYKLNLLVYLATLTVQGYVILSVTEFNIDGSKPRVAYASNIDFKKIVKYYFSKKKA